jgi:hypothetical protein
MFWIAFPCSTISIILLTSGVINCQIYSSALKNIENTIWIRQSVTLNVSSFINNKCTGFLEGIAEPRSYDFECEKLFPYLGKLNALGQGKVNIWVNSSNLKIFSLDIDADSIYLQKALTRYWMFITTGVIFGSIGFPFVLYLIFETLTQHQSDDNTIMLLT